MRCCFSKPSDLFVDLIILPFALALPSTAVAQEWDLGPVPGVVIECFAESEGAGSLAPDSSIDGSWLQVRRDRKLTGRSPLVGDITCPQVLWSYDAAQTRKTWFSAVPAVSVSEISLPTVGSEGDSYQTQKDFEYWGIEIDLDGDGSQVFNPLDSGDRIGDILPLVAGFERVSCQPGVLGLSPDPEEPVPCYLQNRRNGDWDPPLWVSDPISGIFEDNAFSGTPILGDFDDDGDTEVAVKGWYHITTLDRDTGAVEKIGTFRDPTAGGEASGRAYGWWGAINLDGVSNPKLEFVILGDFEQFISVIGWVNGELEEIWDYEIEAGVNNPTAKHDIGVAPVADVDGDALPEIVVSIFNKSGDQRWHVMSFDGVSGAIEFDLVDSYLTGLEDLDGDGIAELFVTSTTNPGLPDYGDISILSFDGGVLSTVWSVQNKSFVRDDIPGFPDNVHSAAKNRRLNLFYRGGWTAGRPVFVTKEAGSNGIDIDFRVFQFDQDQVTEIASLSGPRLSLISMSSITPQKGMLFQSYTQDPIEGPVSLNSMSGDIQWHGRVDSTDGAPLAGASLLTGTVVGALSENAPPTVVTQGFPEILRALRITNGVTPTEMWERPGRGMTSIDGTPYESVLLADIFGTGELAVVSARNRADGLGVITTYDSLGAIVWERSFDTPGELPPWNEGGITTWGAGNFTTALSADVLVSWRTGTMHSTRMRLLDGQTGVPHWTQEDGGFCFCQECDLTVSRGTGAGGMHMPTLDWDADGLDEILNLFSALFAIYDGEDGEILQQLWTHPFCDPPTVFTETFLQHAMGVVADFSGTGTEQILYGKNAATLAMLEFDATVVWNTTPFFTDHNEFTLQGIGDLDGVGALEIVSVGHSTPGAEIKAFDSATGAERWTLAMPEICELGRFSHVATGDIDGDGRDEALFNDCNFLYAIGENNAGQGEILWRATFLHSRWDADLGEVVIADVDGSGRPQILINTASGYLYGLGQRLAEVVTMSGVNSNHNTDLGVLLRDPDTGGNKFHVIDGGSGNKIRTVSFGSSWVRGYTTLPDANGDLVPEFAVLREGSLLAQVKDVVNNTLLGQPKFNQNYAPIAFFSVGDAGGGVGPDVAMVGREGATGTVQAWVKDVASGDVVSRMTFSKAFVPFAAVAVDNVGDSAAMEIAVLGIDASGNVQAQVKDAQSGNLIGKIKFNKNFTPLFFAAVPNVGGKLKLLTVLGRNESGDIQAQTKRVSDGKLVSNVKFSKIYEPRAFISFADSNGSGRGEITVIGVDDTGKVRAQVKEIAEGTHVKYIFFSKTYPLLDAIAVNGVAGTGRNEIAVLGKNASGQHRLQIKDLITGNLVRNIPVP